MSFTFLNILVLFGIILSFFLAVLILNSKSFRSDVNKYFAVTIISLSFCLTYTYFEEEVPANGVMELISWEFLFPFAFMMYVLKAIKHPLSENKKIWLLLLPCLILSSFKLIDFFFDFDVFDWLSGYREENLILLIEVIAFSFLPFAIALIGFSYLKIREAKHIHDKEKRWLGFNSLFLMVFLALWLIGDPIALLFDFPIWDYLLAILAIFLAGITYLGVHQLNLSEQSRQIRSLQVVDASDQRAKEMLRTDTKPKHSNISQKADLKIQKLNMLMNIDLLYQDPNLSRNIIAEKLGISDGYLSELLKVALKTSFNDYINEHRVKYVIKMFQDEKFDLFSIEAIGLEAGFKTKSVFYNAFKKVTQQTPGAYRKSLSHMTK